MEKITNINIGEQATFYKVQKPEGSVFGKELSISETASDMAVDIQRLYQSQDENEIVKIQNRLSRFFKDNWVVKKTGVNNFLELRDLVEDEEELSRYDQTTQERLKNLDYDLTDAATLANLWNTRVGDEELTGAVENGDVVDVERIYKLPQELAGMGDVMVETALTHARTVREVQLLQSYIDGGGASFRDFQKSLEKLEKLYVEEPEEKYLSQIQMVIAYTRSMMEGFEGEEIKSKEEENVKKQQVESQKKDETEDRDRLNFFKLMWFGGINKDVSAASFDWSKKYDALWIKSISDLAAAGSGKFRNFGDIKKMWDRESGAEAIYKPNNRELMMMLETKGVKESLRFLLHTFFEPGTPENGVYVLKLKDNETVRNYLGDKDPLLKDLVSRLTQGGGAVFRTGDVLKDTADATTAAAIAENILYVTNSWEAAGCGEVKGYSSDAVIELMFPDRVANNKNRDGKAWSGRVGWWASQVRVDALRGNRECGEFCRKWDAGEIYIFPPRMFFSALEDKEVDVVRQDTGIGAKMNLAQALYEGHKINFYKHEDGGLEGSIMADYYSVAGSALNLLSVIKREVPLTRKPEDYLKWRDVVTNGVLKLKDNRLVGRYLNWEFLRWAMVASANEVEYRHKPTTKINFGIKRIVMRTFVNEITFTLHGIIMDQSDVSKILDHIT